MVFVLVALQLPLANFASAAEAAVASCFTPRLAQTLVACNPSVVGGWRKQSVVVLDGVLGREACERLRSEAEAIRSRGLLERAESSGDVMATQVTPDDDSMRRAATTLTALPRAIARAVGRRINDEVRGRQASGEAMSCLVEDGAHTNKLAVVETDGGAYVKHVDSILAGGMDPRKLTAIYYLNPNWSEAQGGHLRAWDAVVVGGDGGEAGPPAGGDGAVRVAPRGDRLVLFWSDGLVHDVEPLRIASEADHRWALTTWHLAADPAADRSLAQGLDPWLDVRHFGAPLTSLTAPARRLATRSLADACGRALQVMTRR